MSLIAAVLLAVTPPHAVTHVCAAKHGEQYVRCAESGGNPRYQHDGVPHPGPSSASGAYGLLSATRRRYGKGCASDRCIAERYVADRFGTWAAAERFHRARGWY